MIILDTPDEYLLHDFLCKWYPRGKTPRDLGQASAAKFPSVASYRAFLIFCMVADNFPDMHVCSGGWGDKVSGFLEQAA